MGEHVNGLTSVMREILFENYHYKGDGAIDDS